LYYNNCHAIAKTDFAWSKANLLGFKSLRPGMSDTEDGKPNFDLNNSKGPNTSFRPAQSAFLVFVLSQSILSLTFFIQKYSNL
jgi:hypothetical protein